VCYKVNFIWSNSAEHGTPSRLNVRHRGVAKRTSCSAFPIISGDLETRHVSAADVAFITINPNSTVVVWVETSGNSRFGNKKGFDVVTALRLDDGGSCFDFRQQWKILHFSRTCRPAVRPTQPPAEWVPGLFPRDKAAGARTRSLASI